MMTVIIYADGEAVQAASQVAKELRAAGHKARCVDGSHLQPSDRERADAVVAHDPVFDRVAAVYGADTEVLGVADMTLDAVSVKLGLKEAEPPPAPAPAPALAVTPPKASKR